jgi:hypothetical protein
MRRLFKCRNHDWQVTERSNILQQDSMGYPLRLCVVECCKCGKTEQMWLDAPECALEEIESGKSFLLEWR